MKTLIYIAALCAASTAFAGVRIENTTRDIATKVADGAPTVTQLQDGKLRTARGAEGGMIIVGTTITILDDKRKQYREMDKESIKKMSAKANDAMAMMNERMKNMTPEQRAQMEKMMGKHIPGGLTNDGKPDVWDAKDTGKSDTVEGRKCQVWTLSRNGALLEELCVVPYKSLPGTEDLEKAIKAMADAFADLAAAMPNADQAVKARNALDPKRIARAFDRRVGVRDGRVDAVLARVVVAAVDEQARLVAEGDDAARLEPRFFVLTAAARRREQRRRCDSDAAEHAAQVRSMVCHSEAPGWDRVQVAAARVSRSRTPSHSGPGGGSSTQIRCTPSPSSSRRIENNSCAACSGRAGMRRWTAPGATPEGIEREYTASFSGSLPRTCSAVFSMPVSMRRSFAFGA